MSDMRPHSKHWWEKVAGAPRKEPAVPGLSPSALYGITETGRRERNEDAILALPLIDAYLLQLPTDLAGTLPATMHLTLRSGF